MIALSLERARIRAKLPKEEYEGQFTKGYNDCLTEVKKIIGRV